MAQQKILLVDDEESLTSMLKLNLESSGRYEVKVVNDPRKAVSEAIAFMPDIILLDIIMANKQGPVVAAEMHEHSVLRDIPIIFLTATVTRDEVDAQKGKIGGHIFIAKPSSLEELMETIDRNI